MSVGKFQISLGLIQSAISGLQTVVVIYLGARTILAGDGFSVGMLIAFLSFRQTFNDRVMGLINQAIQFRFLALHLDRLADIVSSEAEVTESAASQLKVHGAIRLQDVDFQYSPTDRQILSGLDMDIKPGEFVAVTGASGGGKTTLLKLMLGLQAPTGGPYYSTAKRPPQRYGGHGAKESAWWPRTISFCRELSLTTSHSSTLTSTWRKSSTLLSWPRCMKTSRACP